MKIAGLLVFLVACSGKPASIPDDYPSYCYDEKLLTAAVVRCTDKSATRGESRACKRALLASCGITQAAVGP